MPGVQNEKLKFGQVRFVEMGAFFRENPGVLGGRDRTLTKISFGDTKAGTSTSLAAA